MKDIRAAVIVLCLLGVSYCTPAGGETAGTPAVAMEEPAVEDSAATVAPPPQYHEAEPVLRMVERERPRPAITLDSPQRKMRVMVDALLLMMALFTVFSFLGMRKSGGTGYREEPVPRTRNRRGRRTAVEASSPAREAPPVEPERLPQNPRERAERLKSRRDKLAGEIERLMKRI